MVAYGKTSENVVLSDAVSFGVKASTSPTTNTHEVPEPTEQEEILGVVFAVTIIGGSLGLLIYLMKRR